MNLVPYVRVIAVVAIWAVLCGPLVRASMEGQRKEEATAGTLSTFAVASIRPVSRLSGGPCGFTDDGFRCESTSVEQLIETGYSLENESRLSAMPRWGESEKFEINAKVDEAEVAAFHGLPYERRLVFLRSMLEGALAEKPTG